MSDKYHYKITLLLSILAVIVSGCGGSTEQTQDQISTAVAQTVQAKDSLTEVASLPALPTSTPLLDVPSTPNTIATNTSVPVSGAPSCTVSASLVGENPPDGAIYKPGELFWKTWTIKNTGTCTWDTSYQFVYWSGDLMDGLIAYPLPEAIAPEGQKDISIYLKAPATEGTYTGNWKIKTPWGTSFGVGQYDEPIYVQVVVSDDKRPNYQITSVSLALTRDPQEGCPANVYYTLTATISSSGPLEIKYYWNASGSLYTQPEPLIFKTAETKTISYTLGINKRSTKPTDYWIQLFIPEPVEQNFDKIYVNHNC